MRNFNSTKRFDDILLRSALPGTKGPAKVRSGPCVFNDRSVQDKVVLSRLLYIVTSIL